MRVVCPFAGAVHPDTRAALEAWPGEVEYADVGCDDYAYGRLLRKLWADAEDFLVVEHDIVATPLALVEMATCPCVYGANPYAWRQAVGVALGMTRFRSLLMRAYPDAVEIALRIPSNYGEPGHWRQLDVWLQAAVLRDLYGHQPHAHLPPVEHRNFEDTAPDAPLRTRVEGRVYLPPGLVAKIATEVAAERTSLMVAGADMDAVTVIDDAVFEAAQTDPKWRAFCERADAYVSDAANESA